MESDPSKKPFTPEVLDKTVIAIPLLTILQAEEGQPDPRPPQPVIIDINLEFRNGAAAARQRIKADIEAAVKEIGTPGVTQGVNHAKSDLPEQYLFAVLEGKVIRDLVRRDNQDRQPSPPAPPATPRAVQRAI
jgi:serine protease AprX